ncbi:MAG: hypothetical protein QMD22_10340 [archaeon]|nr:hypothetical protein [archaeon]
MSINSQLLKERVAAIEYWINIIKEDLERGWLETVKIDLKNLDRAVKNLKRDCEHWRED